MNGNLWSSILGGSPFEKKYTLNFDGSYSSQANKSGAGCVIRDSQGELVVAASYNITEECEGYRKKYHEDCNVAIVEAIALRNGLKLAKDFNLNLNLIIGDNEQVINLVSSLNPKSPTPPLSGIIQQICGMINLVSQKIVPKGRKANGVADKLASWGCNNVELGGREIYKTYADLPPKVAELIIQEKPYSSRQEEDDGEGSIMAGNIGMAGAAVAGVAMLAWGVSKLFASESSSDQEHKHKAKAPIQTRDVITHKYASNKNPQYTLHFDGSDIHQLKKGGAGCVIRNKQGELVIAAAYNLDKLHLNQFHVAIGEAIAWRNGMKLAKMNKIKLDFIKGDSKEVIDRVRGEEKSAASVSLLNEIIREIREALQEQSIDPWTQVERIGRDDNKVADELASLGTKLGSRMVKGYASDEVLPFELAKLIRQDEIKWMGNKINWMG